jgi:hypothetical protein
VDTGRPSCRPAAARRFGRKRRIVAVVAGIGVVVLAAALSRAGAAAPLRAPLYLSPSGSDAGRCTRTAPCRTFARAFALAAAGQRVLVGPGRFAGQQEIRPSSRARPAVVFEPVRAGTVSIESLDVYGAHVDLRGLRIERDFYVKCGAHDVILRRSSAAFLFIRTATRISVVDSSFGPSENVSSVIGPGNDCAGPPHQVLLDRVTMHDYRSSPFNSVHMECLSVDGVQGLTIRNSRFRRCEDFDILIKPDLDTSRLTLENNWFDMPSPDGYYAVRFSNPESGVRFTDVLVRNNSFGGPLNFEPPGPALAYDDVDVIANLGGRSPCVDDIRWAHNVWSAGDRCGPADRVAAAGFRDAKQFDLHLVPGSAAVDAGDPTSFPARDIDGERRPQGKAPDAGADELRRAGTGGASGRR